MRRFLIILIALFTAAGVAACARGEAPDTSAASAVRDSAKSSPAWVQQASGLAYQVVIEGTGRRVGSGDTVTIHESLSLPDGRTMFDSRVAPNKPVTFTMGANQVIRGVEEGVTGMRVGERRHLRVPPALDGRKFDASFIPPDAIRLYDIEVIAAKP